MKWRFVLCLLYVCAWQVNAQESLLYTNVWVHVGNGDLIEGGLSIKDGVIEGVYAKDKLPAKTGYSKVIDGAGKHVYPALIAPNTRLGLEEIEAVRATNDYREVGRFNPNVRSIIAYNTDSEVMKTVNSNGVLLTQVVPEGGRISGQSSLCYLQADNWEDAAAKMDDGIHLHWPNRFHYTGWWAQKGKTKANKNYLRDVEAIKVYLEAAMAYTKKEKVEKKNLKFEAMRGVFAGEKRLYVHVDHARSMLEAIRLLESYKEVKLVFQGANEAWKIAEELAQRKIPVILTNVHRLPMREDSPIDQPYAMAAELAEKGVKFALSMKGSWNVRNLPFQAGQAVAYGLDKERAISAMTLHTAEIMGVDDRLGSLEKGKDASFIVVKGDVMDMRSSVVVDAYIRGEIVDLGDKQKELYDKYMKRYKLKK